QGGPVLHLLRKDYALMPNFPENLGEIYFSQAEYGSIKAWKRHLSQSQLFAVPLGEMHIVIYDPRKDSQSYGQILELNLGRPDNYGLLKIPKGLWYGFRALTKPCALLCNCPDLPHDPKESEHLPFDSPLIPYSWKH
ncbi:MAG: dTDP-4-dehydrorhamnose 3,5-epimerase family protein, partial [Desulfovibrionaceae bacterium]|nr:dTDP-4-dehydrorhamnose 3,5-epimerase family protein [Desulfovibrionaceae bacterium]